VRLAHWYLSRLTCGREWSLFSAIQKGTHARTEVGWDSSVVIANFYGLDGTGIESLLGARFTASVHSGPGAYPASFTMGGRSFLGVKLPGSGVDYTHPSSAEVKERV
jgi:hypothetical protein